MLKNMKINKKSGILPPNLELYELFIALNVVYNEKTGARWVRKLATVGYAVWDHYLPF